MPVDAEGKVTATVRLTVAGQELEIEMRLPARPTRARELLPLYRGVAENLVQVGVDAAAAAGREVSCRKGCGACCRQLVPISELEAWRIAELIEELPAARRAEIGARFEAARDRLAQTGLLPMLRDRTLIRPGDAASFGLRYFAAGVACPFLEDEACSIYDERPLACREYLVTSPAENCSRPTPDTIARVPLPGSAANAIRWLTAPPAAEQSAWVPLSLAPEWAASHPESAPDRTGPELARQLFERLSAG